MNVLPVHAWPPPAAILTRLRAAWRAGAVLATVDPGEHGAMAFLRCTEGLEEATAFGAPKLELLDCGRGYPRAVATIARERVPFVVVEGQYLGKSPTAYRTLVLRLGILMGQILQVRPLTEFVVVYPSTWQARFPGRSRRLMMEDLLKRFPATVATTVADREGEASARAMADWLRSVLSDEKPAARRRTRSEAALEAHAARAGSNTERLNVRNLRVAHPSWEWTAEKSTKSAGGWRYDGTRGDSKIMILSGTVWSFIEGAWAPRGAYHTWRGEP